MSVPCCNQQCMWDVFTVDRVWSAIKQDEYSSCSLSKGSSVISPMHIFMLTATSIEMFLFRPFSAETTYGMSTQNLILIGERYIIGGHTQYLFLRRRLAIAFQSKSTDTQSRRSLIRILPCAVTIPAFSTFSAMCERTILTGTDERREG